MIITEYEQGTPEWLEVRLGKLSASRFNQLITTTGKPSSSADKYINLLISERLTGRREDVFVSQHMERGTKLETNARSSYEFETGNIVKEVGFILPYTDAEYGCSPDGLIGDDGGLELKVPAHSTMIGYHRDESKLAVAYKQQVQGCMFVTGREWWDLYAYSESLPSISLRIERDDEYISKMLVEITNAVTIVKAQTEKLI